NDEGVVVIDRRRRFSRMRRAPPFDCRGHGLILVPHHTDHAAEALWLDGLFQLIEPYHQVADVMRFFSRAATRPSSSTVSIALRLASRMAATACPSSGVISPVPTASAKTPTAATTSCAVLIEGSWREIGRPFLTGQILARMISAARMSPPFAASMTC